MEHDARAGLARWLVAQWSASLRAAMEFRAAFLGQVIFMIANNLLFLVFWVIFFERFEQVGGWGLRELALLYGVAAAGFGLSMVFLGGLPELARRISQGRLDDLLLKPRPVLCQAAVSKMRVSGLGDLAVGVGLFAVSGHAQGWDWLFFPVASVIACLAFGAFGTICSSLAFWAGRADTVAAQATHALVVVAIYPPGAFSGWSRTVLFLLLPAGLMSYLPAELLIEWSWSQAGVLLFGNAVLFVLALWAWSAGLARYESGNLTQALE
ncbi:MAG: ABC-2 family transporter protein [Acidobacteriota bacterium]